MPRKSARVAGVAGLWLFLSAAAGVAGEPPPLEPRALEILSAAMRHLAAAGSFTLRAETVEEIVLPSGERLEYPGTLEMALRRPARLRYRADGEGRRTAGWYDGSVFTLLDPDRKACATAAAPGDLAALFDLMKERLGFRPPLWPLLRPDAAEAVPRRVKSGFVVGRGAVGGAVCDHLALRQEGLDLQLWVAAEGPPVIRRIVLTRSGQPGAPQSTYASLAWDFSPSLTDADFAPEMPQGVVKCEFQRWTGGQGL